MGILSDLNLNQLRQATLTQIRTAISTKLATLNKKQLCILILKVADIDIKNMEVQDREEGEGDSRGPLWLLRVVRDVLGNKLRSTRFDYTYYPPQPDRTRPRDIITTTEMDENDQVIGIPKKLKHYPDGKQPEWL